MGPKNNEQKPSKIHSISQISSCKVARKYGITVTGLANFGFNPLLWHPQGPQWCLEKQNYPFELFGALYTMYISGGMLVWWKMLYKNDLKSGWIFYHFTVKSTLGKTSLTLTKDHLNTVHQFGSLVSMPKCGTWFSWWAITWYISFVNLGFWSEFLKWVSSF